MYSPPSICNMTLAVSIAELVLTDILLGGLTPGEYPKSKIVLTGHHSVEDYPLVIWKSW